MQACHYDMSQCVQTSKHYTMSWLFLTSWETSPVHPAATPVGQLQAALQFAQRRGATVQNLLLSLWEGKPIGKPWKHGYHAVNWWLLGDIPRCIYLDISWYIYIFIGCFDGCQHEPMVCCVIKFDVLPCSYGLPKVASHSSGRKEPEDEGTGALWFHEFTLDMAVLLGLTFDFAIGLEWDSEAINCFLQQRTPIDLYILYCRCGRSKILQELLIASLIIILI